MARKAAKIIEMRSMAVPGRRDKAGALRQVPQEEVALLAGQNPVIRAPEEKRGTGEFPDLVNREHVLGPHVSQQFAQRTGRHPCFHAESEDGTQRTLTLPEVVSLVRG